MRIFVRTLRSTISAILVICFAGCNTHENKGPANAAARISQSRFAQIQVRILKTKCLNCHSGNNSAKGIDLSSYKVVMASGTVHPKEPDLSPFYTAIRLGKMPKSSPPLSNEEADLVYQWIKNGAGESDGEQANPVLNIPIFTEDTTVKYSDSAISDIFGEKAAYYPTNLTEVKSRIETRFRYVDTNIVPFSDAPFPTSLEEPRILYGSEDTEIYFGAIPRLNGSIDMEFLSRNRKTGAYDFGVVERFGRSNAKVKFVEKSQCTGCHRDSGPLYMEKVWSNTLDSGGDTMPERSVFAAFINTRAQFEEKFWEYAKELKKKTDAPTALQWQGIHLRQREQRSPFFERIVNAGNQMQVIRSYILQANSVEECRERMDKVLKVLLGRSPVETKLLTQELVALPRNRPGILKDNFVVHFERTMKKSILSASVEDITKYNDLVRANERPHSAPDISPTLDSSFNPDSKPIGGATKSGLDHTLDNMKYNYAVARHLPEADSNYPFKDSLERPFVPTKATEVLGKRLAANLGFDPFKTEMTTLEELDRYGVERQKVLMEFLKSKHYEALLDSPVMLAEDQVSSVFSDYVLGRPISNFKDLPHVVEPGIEKKRCLDCHASAQKPYFSFEPSSIAAWVTELSSGDEERKKLALKRLPRVVEHLKKRTMPPPEKFSLDISETERTRLILFLEKYE